MVPRHRRTHAHLYRSIPTLNPSQMVLHHLLLMRLWMLCWILEVSPCPTWDCRGCAERTLRQLYCTFVQR
ncbi:hypothetical protein PF005_g20037 [Phytophthora fragariae]|uniref:Uncharacterized protein n=1 Tax=Phytophthora fragariae TaxID=53985 RepID=A0A6A3ERL4_9STRA|nr:hypothetical protein PF003_g6642 [Phytophthora fragariae]KAE8934581.1 hypothetical protein PF009_g15439 [Phytophthora fragariae]KAE8993073.1 hypothetical protein PF011_g17283 [Phytophthora fragariae]KAE9090901.1 hypothetical protein PF010_g18408 [Phytophthora fragariae]KAE9102530.1 hypothetical protein PF007_g14731 [Phytophthora fragariae]